MAKRWALLVWIVVITAVASCSARFREPVSVPRGKTVTFAGGDLRIRNCYYVREYMAPDEDGKRNAEEWYNHLALTVNGEEIETERPLGMNVLTGDGYEITILEMEPEREVMCIVSVVRIE